METKFNSQICTTIEQSERLLALGLKKETADMHYEWCGEWYLYNTDYASSIYDMPFGCDTEEERQEWESRFLPAWSLLRLLMMIDSDVQTDGRYISLPNYGFVKKDNIYDNLCDYIEWLIKEGYFNKEYLKG